MIYIYMVIYVTLTILTERGNLSLSSWYLRVVIALLIKFKTYNFVQIDMFFLKKF